MVSFDGPLSFEDFESANKTIAPATAVRNDLGSRQPVSFISLVATLFAPSNYAKETPFFEPLFTHPPAKREKPSVRALFTWRAWSTRKMF